LNSKKSRLARIEGMVADLSGGGRTCICPLPEPQFEWETDEGVAELVQAFTRPCPKCGLIRWDESALARFEKLYGGASAI
jgi:hypothetical protein